MDYRIKNVHRWLDRNRESKKRRLHENHAISDPSATNSISNWYETEMMQEKMQDDRFEETGNLLVDKKDLAVSLIVNLYRDSFSLQKGDQTCTYPYNRTTKNFLAAMDEQRFSTDYAELLGSWPLTFYEGCLVVEVHDYRLCLSDQNKPEMKRILLKPTAESLIKEIGDIVSKNFKQWTPEDLLAVEQRILLSKENNLCFDPSVSVTTICNQINFDQHKTHVPPKRKPVENVSKYAPVQFSVLNYLKEKGHAKQSKPLSVTVHQTLNQIIHQTTSVKNENDTMKTPDKAVIANPITLASTTPKNSPLVDSVEGRKLRFHANAGKTFCFFQIGSKKSGGYEGIIRVGKAPDTGINGDLIRFSLGNATNAARFVEQMKSLYEKEGFGTLVYDSYTGFGQLGHQPNKIPMEMMMPSHQPQTMTAHPHMQQMTPQQLQQITQQQQMQQQQLQMQQLQQIAQQQQQFNQMNPQLNQPMNAQQMHQQMNQQFSTFDPAASIASLIAQNNAKKKGGQKMPANTNPLMSQLSSNQMGKKGPAGPTADSVNGWRSNVGSGQSIAYPPNTSDTLNNANKLFPITRKPIDFTKITPGTYPNNVNPTNNPTLPNKKNFPGYGK